MSSELFAGAPSISIPRSKWGTSYNITGSHKHGYLIPVDFIPVIPGDGHNLKFKDITRMQTPLAPIFGNIKQHFAAFFVPLRLVWAHAEEFYGANKTSAGYQQTTYTFPMCQFARVDIGSVSHYLGKPYKGYDEVDADGNGYYLANFLKERCYYLIWNEYFRAQQITNPVLLKYTDGNKTNIVTNHIGTWNGSYVNPGDAATSLMRVAKEFDYFTATTLYPQYGPAVTLPFTTDSVPIIAEDDLHSTNKIIGFGTSNENADWSTLGTRINLAGSSLGASSGDPQDAALAATPSTGDISSFDPIDRTNLIADLSNVTMTKINDIRYAFAIQKYLERSNFAGNYFFGILQVHYGVTSPDSRLQRPEFLGEFTEDILVHQVVATADTVNSGVKTSVGNTGAVSVTASGLVGLCSKAFVEPGYLCIVKWCRHRQVYSQGVMREDFKDDRFEIYSPELCNLGDQSTLTRELYWKAGEKAVFGAQEHWAEYRYRPDRVTGLLDPAKTGNLDYWTLANKFTSVPELNDDFIMEDRTNLDRALVTGSAYDEYISDTFIVDEMTREMPVRTMPGLIDHFGAM